MVVDGDEEGAILKPSLDITSGVRRSWAPGLHLFERVVPYANFAHGRVKECGQRVSIFVPKRANPHKAPPLFRLPSGEVPRAELSVPRRFRAVRRLGSG